MKTLNDAEMNDTEKAVMARHLREDEEVYYVVRDVKSHAEEIRTFGQALFDRTLAKKSKAKGTDKFTYIVFTRLKDSGEPARMLFLHGIDARGPRLHFNKSNTKKGTEGYYTQVNTLRVSTPHSIVFSPTLVYRLITEQEKSRIETQEKVADRKVTKEIRRAEAKAKKIAAKEERKHPSGRNFSTWYEVRSLDVDKKLLKGGFVSLTVVVENFKRRNAKDFGTIEQIKNDMGVSAKGASSLASGRDTENHNRVTSSIQRPYELDLFFRDKTEEVYAKFREILGT
ncbi:MAG: hypothetical protein QW597_03235 [Thermoplasmataceae archaeon]